MKKRSEVLFVFGGGRRRVAAAAKMDGAAEGGKKLVVAGARSREPKTPTGEGGRALTRRQKGVLARLAKLAAANCHEATEGEEHEEWRAMVAVETVGKRISEASQLDYKRLKCMFEIKAGKMDEGLASWQRGIENERRVVEYKLEQVLREKGLHVSYVEVICRQQYKCELGEASAAQLWRLFYTVRNRRKGGGN